MASSKSKYTVKKLKHASGYGVYDRGSLVREEHTKKAALASAAYYRGVEKSNPPSVKRNKFIPCTGVRVTRRNGRAILEIRRTVKIKRKKR